MHGLKKEQDKNMNMQRNNKKNMEMKLDIDLNIDRLFNPQNKNYKNHVNQIFQNYEGNAKPMILNTT